MFRKFEYCFSKQRFLNQTSEHPFFHYTEKMLLKSNQSKSFETNLVRQRQLHLIKITKLLKGFTKIDRTICEQTLIRTKSKPERCIKKSRISLFLEFLLQIFNCSQKWYSQTRNMKLLFSILKKSFSVPGYTVFYF